MKHTLNSALKSANRNPNLTVGAKSISINKPVGNKTWGMLDFLKKQGYTVKQNHGFTLVELIVVIAIIMILVTIALPRYMTFRESAQETAFDATVRHLEQVATLHIVSGGEDAIWSAQGGTKAGTEITGSHETWFNYFDEWPTNPLGTGDFVVEIAGDTYTITPRRD